MNNFFSIKNKTGVTVVEAVIAIAIFSILATVAYEIYIGADKLVKRTDQKATALWLAEEGLEAVRSIRDESFANLTTGQNGLAVSSNQWTFAGTEDTSGIYWRAVTLASIDADNVLATSTVSWSYNGATNTVSLGTIFTNWHKIVSAVGDWSTTTLPFSLDLSGTHDGRKIQVVGDYAYIVRADGTPDFSIFDVSMPDSPSLLGSLSLTGGQTNIFVSGNYAYVSSDDDNGELKIINISNPNSPVLTGTYNGAGAGNGNGVYVTGTRAYLVRTNSGSNPDFLIINVSNPATPTLIGSLNLGQIGYEVAISGNYAYCVTGDNSQELKIISITNPASPSLVGSLNLPGTTDAITVSFSGSTLFIGQGSNLYSVNITIPTSPTLLNSLSVVGTLNDIALNLGNAGTYLFIGTSDANNEFKVINVSNSSAMSILGQRNLAVTNPLLGIAYDVIFDRAFVVSSLDTLEFLVIAPKL